MGANPLKFRKIFFIFRMVNTKRKQVNRNKISLGKDEEKREFLCFAGWTATGIVDPQKVKNRMII